jgi:hypothetical protein
MTTIVTMTIANPTSIHTTTAVIVTGCVTTASRDRYFSLLVDCAFEVSLSFCANRVDAMFRFGRFRVDLICSEQITLGKTFLKTFKRCN